jgi:hypothetical protein
MGQQHMRPEKGLAELVTEDPQPLQLEIKPTGAPGIVPGHQVHLDEIPAGSVQLLGDKVRRIFLIEDDYTLECDLKNTVATHNSTKRGEQPCYELVPLNPDKINPNQRETLIPYLKSLGITSDDVVVVDLNLKGYNTGTRRVNYTGHDILKAIDTAVGADKATAKARKTAPELEALANATYICATSLMSEIQDPDKRPNPRLGMLQHITLYGMEKARGRNGEVVSYGAGVLYMISKIDESKLNPDTPTVIPLNN